MGSAGASAINLTYPAPAGNVPKVGSAGTQPPSFTSAQACRAQPRSCATIPATGRASRPALRARATNRIARSDASPFRVRSARRALGMRRIRCRASPPPRPRRASRSALLRWSVSPSMIRSAWIAHRPVVARHERLDRARRAIAAARAWRCRARGRACRRRATDCRRKAPPAPTRRCPARRARAARASTGGAEASTPALRSPGFARHRAHRRQTPADTHWWRSRTAGARRRGRAAVRRITGSPSSSTQSVTGGPSPRRLICQARSVSYRAGSQLPRRRIHCGTVRNHQRGIGEHRHIDLDQRAPERIDAGQPCAACPFAGERSATTRSGSADGGAAVPGRATNGVRAARTAFGTRLPAHRRVTRPRRADLRALARLAIATPRRRGSPRLRSNVVRERWTMRRTAVGIGRAEGRSAP